MSTITKEFTKEQLIEKLQHRISVASGFPESEKAQMDLELARIALASLEAEHVCVIDQSNLDYLNSGSDADVWPASRAEMGDVLLYRAAPPVPVSVKIPPEKPHTDGPLADGWNACRAAMLQGAERVSNRDELPDGWMACSERMPEQYDYEIWTYSPTKGVNHSLGYDGHARTFSDVDYYSTIDDVTHWMPITRPAAPRQETK